ncbi:MAG TPA: ComEC/Rec2 family competence protein [Acidimicrobiales bacterium]|nr:ComEC/Rec2 family competence protein [Acidimicrobiales bacterium]
MTSGAARRGRQHVVDESAAVALAAASAGGAIVAFRIPLVVGIAVGVIAVARGRPWLLVFAAGLAASSLAAGAMSGTVAPVAPVGSIVEGVATLVTDPVAMHGDVKALARVRDRQLELTAEGSAAPALRGALAGEQLMVSGHIRRITGPGADRLAARHVGWRLRLDVATFHSPGRLHVRLANHFRRTLERGARALPPIQRPLFAGLVYGDDRGQDVAVAADFRSSGLSHVLVVSGQNVAFALALATPALRRLRLWPRSFAAIGVLLAFGVLTRWEPSVLRASIMAAISLLAGTLGRPASRVRILAIAVTVAVLADALLVRSVGFQLSVAACAGIAALAHPLAERLRGPSWLREAAGTTMAAQVGVAPLLVVVFGGVPVVSIAANVLAAPAVAPVMVWGALAGALAGVVGGGLAPILHLPTRVLLWWLAGVARWCAAIPLGRLALAGTALALMAIALWMTGGRKILASILLVVSLASPAVAAPRNGEMITPGARLWSHGGGRVLVIERPTPSRLLDALHAARISRLDLLVLTTVGGSEVAVVVRSRVRVTTTIAPGGTKLGSIITPPSGATIRIGPHAIEVRHHGSTLSANVRRRRRPASPGDRQDGSLVGPVEVLPRQNST